MSVAHTVLLPRAALALLAALLLLTLALPAQASASQTAAVQAHLLWSQYDDAAVNQQLDKVKDSGAGMVRVDLGWASLEKDGKGQYDPWYLGKIDNVVGQANARGIKVLFTFWETPCWASTAPESLKQGCTGSWWDRGVQRYAPANPADYADALAYLAKRYGRSVAAWELWNEPNQEEYFKADDPVASYARLVKATYPVAKAADPGATILAGSLADADFDFTEALYKQGVKGNFDAWSVHPYSEDRSPLDRGIAGWTKKSFVVGVPAVRDTMLRHGDDKPLWLTEFGWSTCNVRGGRELYNNCVDPAKQATYLQLAYKQMQAFSYVPVGVSFNLEDTGSDPGSRMDNYGLVNEGSAEKPAFTAFRTAALALSSGRAVPTPTGSGDVLQKGRAASRRIQLRVFRTHGRVVLKGTLPIGRTLRVRVSRSVRRSGRSTRTTTYRKLIRVSPSGRFSHRIASRATASGKLKIMVKNRLHPMLKASAVLG